MLLYSTGHLKLIIIDCFGYFNIIIFIIMNKTQKLIIAIIAGFLAIIIPYYLFFN